jgi:hypothetical protein
MVNMLVYVTHALVLRRPSAGDNAILKNDATLYDLVPCCVAKKIDFQLNPQNVLKHKKKNKKEDKEEGEVEEGAVMGFEAHKLFSSVTAFRTVYIINPTFHVANVKANSCSIRSAVNSNRFL